jgi:replication factor C subunit 3/5
MALWVDKYRPSSLGKLTLHSELNSKLLSLAGSEEIPHLLFYGPSGAGKKTRVLALLREIYGPGSERVKLEHRTFKTSSKTIEVTTLGSNYHIECNPSDAGNNDRFVIQEVIKEIASHGTLQTGAAGARGFKVVVLTEVDRLSRQAQAGLRRTMEKYSSQCRIFLICNSPSKVIEPVRSRCLGIRVPSPTHDEIADVLVTVAKKESSACDRELAMKISIHSERNIRRALLMLEACKVQSGGAGSQSLSKELTVQLPDWELFIVRLAREILQEQSPSKLLHVREMLYELLTNCIPADVIMQTLTRELMKALDDSLKHELAHWAAYYENRIMQGNKEIFHLEAFVAKFMAVYKRWLISLFA